MRWSNRSVHPGERGRTHIPGGCGARRPAGASLIEMVIAVAVLLVISMAAFLLFSRFATAYQVQAEGSTLHTQAQVALNQMLQEIEDAGYPSAQALGATAGSNCIAQGFTLADQTSMTFEAALQPAWTGTSSSATGCPSLPTVNSPGSGVSLPVSTVSYMLQGTTLTRTVTDKATGSSHSSAVLRNVEQARFGYFCLGPSSVTADTVQNVCGVSAEITAQTGSVDQQTQQPVYTTVHGAAYARNTVLGSFNPSQGCDHACSFSLP